MRQQIDRFIFNLKIAFEALLQNKVRSFLTALGIIFGVASVIAMQAIGSGAREEILEQIKQVGVNNIVITQKAADEEEKQKEEGEQKQKKSTFSLGLNTADAEGIRQIIPEISHVSPEVSFDVFAIRKGKGYNATLKGVTHDHFKIFNLALAEGYMFSQAQAQAGYPVCIITEDVRNRFFQSTSVTGKKIKCGDIWLTITGVLKGKGVLSSAASQDMQIYAPLHTVLMRYNDRSLITKARLNDDEDEDASSLSAQNKKQFNQLNKIVVQVSGPQYMEPASHVIKRILLRRHNGAEDFEIAIPELLLKQQQQTKDTFNLVLGVIAGISLLVGGIGIMNIMLVSVTERLKEIGLRMALGATRADIVMQFLAEAILISISGGIIGMALGILGSEFVSRNYDIKTIITLSSLMVAFIFALGVGLIFGIAPARKAAHQDPIESLRHE